MAYDRFLIAPLTSGLDTSLKSLLKNASFGRIVKNIRGHIVKRYKKRVDVKDITGLRSGDLTALYYIGRGKYRGVLWRCKCDCGKECDVFGGHLRLQSRKSCGCRSEARVTETGISRVYGSYKAHALKRKLEFSITREKFGPIILQNCHYCGRTPANVLKRQKSKKLSLLYNGIDRFDPTKGYTDTNCVPCCYYCNHAKLDLTFEQWLSHLKLIFSYQGITNGI